MKSLTISKKFTFLSLTVTFVSLLIGYLLLNNYKQNLIEQEYASIVHELQDMTHDRMNAKLDVGISNAISIANDHYIKEALATNNRELAIAALSNLSANMKANTPFKNIKVHIHTKNNHSFLRSWVPEKFGDDLSSFRKSVVKVNASQGVVNTLEVGKAGLSIRSVVPVFSENNEHVGSLEFMQGINSVAKLFDQNQEGFLLLMDASLAVAKIDEANKLKEYVISQKFVNKAFLNDAKTIDFKELKANKILNTQAYTYTYVDIKDFEGNVIGMALVGEPYDVVHNAINTATKLIVISLMILAGALIVTLVASLFVMKKFIIGPINDLKEAIDSVKESRTKSSYIEVQNNDEIGDVVKSFNEYLGSIKAGMEKDKTVIDEARVVIEKVNSGLFNDQIKQEANSKEVAMLIGVINDMIVKTKNNLLTLSQTLVELSHAKYDLNIPRIEGMTGLIASLFNGIRVTQATMSEVMALIDSSNTKLESSSKELSDASKRLSESSNLQAVSLEETAAAIEEIASTIKQSSDNAQKMTNHAQSVTKANEVGRNLANQTVTAMDELSDEVNSILEAITVIDQIAFQTNILSLNAAVEAATAGEAGKGFAVVAQEVRNLASRSAEAAKEIKEIVESATIKANSSKEVTDKMLQGYNALDDNINQTIGLIEEVANAAKEQQTAISQINDTVNSLDKATQENASLAATISTMAENTQNLVEQLREAVSNTTFSEASKKRICEPDMIFRLNKLKSDHIVFKDNNFCNCGVGKNFTVKNHHECDLGKWIDENKERPFAQTQEWKELLIVHEDVHSKVQKTVDLYAQGASNEEIFTYTKDVEDSAFKVFNLLDRLREMNCSTQEVEK
ncbi:methyl-accepting chemotaxis protein [Candidatus Marinarcus aquaticus]|uniref:Chemotaxis protein n=1 Tax=Candidatus Marinarcus aquaticus TaxID=2044504 RepID=A0A4Q0XUN8_9BACT|nr:methyl-accepting chemotaxis protein [Candidatus Marinarcus aquaticus]RXJ58161.1 chemotaxis protein [Candidatus Marinarcus aquaticus]